MPRTNEDRFRRGELGADGEPVAPEALDPSEQEQAAAVEALTRNRAYLGREFLTWALWASNEGRPLCTVDDEDVRILVVGKVVLRGLAGEATELAVRGHLSAYSDVVRFAIDRGLLVHGARWRIEWRERVFEATLDAEYLDVRSATLPTARRTDDDDDDVAALDRLAASAELGALIDAAWAAFIELRASPRWSRRVVPAIKSWLAGDG